MAYRNYRQPEISFGRVLRELRKRLNLSQSEIAKILRCDASAVSGYEFGRYTPSTARLICLLRLAEGNERGPILKALREHGVLESDLAAPPAVEVSGERVTAAASEAAPLMDAPEAAAQ
jgi:transcriptional regulator with XRE-family HTH domain